MNSSSEHPWSAQLAQRKQNSLMRSVSLPPPHQINFSSNDYLGLAKDPRIIAAGQTALEQYGNSSTASPLICGYGEPHFELEAVLQQWYGLPAALIFNSGYSANQAVLSKLPQSGDLVLADRLIHNSMISGIIASDARLIRYNHLDIDHLETLLAKYSPSRRVWVITESVFSMDGDYPELAKIARLKEQYTFYWMVDEAHALGWYGHSGSGLCEDHDVLDQVDILLGTMGKALGGFGAYVLFRDPVWREYLINFAAEFIYSTYLPPALAVTGIAAIKIIQEITKEERFAFQQMAKQFRERLCELHFDLIKNESPIISFVVGDNQKVLDISQALQADGILVGAIRPPTVPKESARLRISVSRLTTEPHIQSFCQHLAQRV